MEKLLTPRTLLKTETREHRNSIHLSKKELCLVIYASTLGELNSIQTLINKLLSRQENLKLILLTDHIENIESYKSKYPNSITFHYSEETFRVENILIKYTPKIFIISEIPARLHDAPCRLAYKTLQKIREHNCPIVVANGWLYHEKPSCRMDLIEKFLFSIDYLNCIDLFLVQSEETRNSLIKSGASPKRIHTTGNMKFDILNTSSEPENPIIDTNKRPTIVGGCVTNIDEQKLVIDAFYELTSKTKNALLIIAPRNPENTSRMEKLKSMIKERHLTYECRSNKKTNINAKTNVLILDTIGELTRFYAISDICYVGLNHNLIEPLNHSKPTIVTPGWDRAYPSYPVYELLIKTKNIIKCDSTNHTDLYIKFEQSLKEKKHTTNIKYPRKILGATKRNINLIESLI